MTVSAFQWYPTQINGYKFRGRNADFFQLPDTLLAVPAGLTAECGNLSRMQLTEFKTEHWFLTDDTTKALNGKVRERVGVVAAPTRRGQCLRFKQVVGSFNASQRSS